jgi:hypothetical protein
MVFTSLHRELGREPSDMTYELLLAAVDQGVREQDDLDWKRALPVKEGHDAFAKDVAAMANSGGGLLVFGVAEVPDGTSAAGSLVNVEKWDDGEQRRLRQVAYSVIQPPVHGLTFYDLESDGVRAVALAVPASSDAPHLVWAKEKFTAPLRYGAQTEHMNEHQLEGAYTARRQARSALLSRLRDAAAAAIRPVTTPTQVWLSVTAAPTVPRPAYLPRLTSEQFTHIITSSLGSNPFLVGTPPGLAGISPRPRYRRWTTIDSYQGVADRLIEIHDDGTLVYAVALHEVKDGLNVDLHPKTLQEAPAEALWLLRQVNTAVTPGAEYVVRVDLHSGSWPVYLRRYERGFLADRDNPILSFEPVEVTLDPQADVASLRRDLWAFVTDIVNQGGSQFPSRTFLHQPPSS